MKLKGEKGFTLIELLLVIALLMITAGVTTDIVLTLVRSYSKTKITNEVEQVGNFALTKIEKELRVAKSVSAPNVGATSNFVRFLNSQDKCIQYTVTGGALRRDQYDNTTCTGTQVAAESGAVFLASSGGVKLSTGTFQRISTAPDIIKIVFVFEQFETASLTPAAFTGNVRLEQTVVVRGTYN